MGGRTAWCPVVPPHHQENCHWRDFFYVSLWIRGCSTRKSRSPHSSVDSFLRRVEQCSTSRSPRPPPSICDDAILWEALNKLYITRLHNRTVQMQPIQVGDLVLHRMEAVASAGEHGKLTANWEGPYKVASQVRPGT